MTDPLHLHYDQITSSRPVDVRDQLGHNDAAHAAAADAAGLQRERGHDDGAPSRGEDGRP